MAVTGIDRIKKIQRTMKARRFRCPNAGQNTAKCRVCGFPHRGYQGQPRTAYRRRTPDKGIVSEYRDITAGKQIGDIITDGFMLLGLSE